MSPRILLADDHALMRQGLRALIGDVGGVTVVGEAEDGRATVRMALDLCPDLVIMDVGLPSLNGVEATRLISAEGRGIRVLGLSMHSEGHFVAEMLRAGAAGYMLKSSAFTELATAIETVMAGKTYLSPEIAGTVVDHLLRGATSPSQTAYTLLTSREREIIQLIAEGKSTQEMARVLYLSVKTVETHRKHLMDKLGIHSVAGLTKYAIREGLTGLDD